MKTNIAIEVTDLNKKFKSGYGIENINFKVEYGKVFGYLGPNGAGKSTTLRILMGFIKSDSGKSSIHYFKENNKEISIDELISYDSWTDSQKIQKKLGYVPGEIAFPIHMTGTELLKQVFKLRNMTNWDVVKKYIEYWEFNPNIKIKKMSKGMKQKVALIIAWMHNPDVIVLDEPTTGLDPLMQDKFIKLVKKTKEEGKAIILSSHIFSEIEKTCDYVSIIKRGKIISTINIKDIQYNDEKKYEISFKNKLGEKELESNDWKILETEKNSIYLVIENNKINTLLKKLSSYEVEFIKEHPLDLEQYFMKYYQNEVEKDVINTDNEYIPKKTNGKEHKISLELIKDTSKKSVYLWLFMTLLPILMIITSFIVVLNNPNFIEQINNGKTTWDMVINNLVVKLIASTTGIVYLLMLVYILVTGNGLIASEVEKGTLVNLLTTNQSRKSVVLSKIFTFVSYLSLSCLLFYITTIIGIISTGHSENINYAVITLYFVGLFLLLLMMSSISFIASSYFNKSAYSLSFAGGIIILFYVLFFIAQIDESVNFFKYLTLNTLYRTDYNKTNELIKYLPQDIVMLLISIGLYTSGYFIFIKKDLPL
ncbi:ABC transporter ATP-binding protein [Spiroplasma corruscae]|uniref:ABC transporter ATP-binding protein n=1 Tax=Spiroplasma corruscae TaxID=216934 RepID=A0A222ENR8_9MOLU|nr:ATP-binding cassette domain-containing protein [Spiroplasma corruscae]ASP27933.1 ABC transporter ATP-binding protein [Spiroplasma corruscae]